MKKILAFLLAVLCVLPLSACSRDMNWVISNEPSVLGIVEEIEEDYVLVRVIKADDVQLTRSSLVRTEKATRLNDCKFNAQVGDEVVVYYARDAAITMGGVPEISEIHGYCLVTPFEAR